MVKAIKKALGIHSPSRVFKRLGVQTLDGLQVGLRNTAGVEAQMRSVSKTVTKSFDPTLSTTAGGTGTAPIINVYVNGVITNPTETGRQIATSLSAYYAAGGRKVA